MSNKETTLNKRYEKHLNLELRNLASQNVQRDYYIKEQEPGLIDLYSKDGFEIGELIELGFKSIEDVARYIDILSGYKNPKLFPEQPIGRTNREKFIGTCIMLDASAQECLKDLLESNYKIWPDSFHSFIIAEDRDTVAKLIKKYHLTEMRRGVDIFDTHNVYNGDIVDYVSQSTINGDEYSGASINRTLKDIMRDARKTRHDEYTYLSQKYDFDESLEKSIYEEMNEIDDEESLNESINTNLRKFLLALAGLANLDLLLILKVKSEDDIVVHHINKDRSINDIDNLVLMNKSHHISMHNSYRFKKWDIKAHEKYNYIEIKDILDKLNQIIKNSCKKDEQETEQEVEKELV
jgi:hypothetical protein